MSYFFLAIGAAAIFTLRSYARASRLQQLRQRRPKVERYNGVSITYSERHACSAVKAVGTRRFLSGEAPLLPLSGCSADKCRCRYKHFEDRREDNRRDPFGANTSVPPDGGCERRSGRDRRKSGTDLRDSFGSFRF